MIKDAPIDHRFQIFIFIFSVKPEENAEIQDWINGDFFVFWFFDFIL